MTDIYFTIAGTNHHYGQGFINPQMEVKLVKEPDNEADKEAIRVEMPGLGLIGYVANSPYTVIGESYSAGRLYDKIGDTAVGTVKYVLPKGVLCVLNQKEESDCEREGADLMKTIHVAAAVIHSGNRIFATQRGYGEYKDGWEFPGGKLEPGETPEDAIKREIREELDTEISVGELIDTIEYDYPDFHLTMDCFWCEVVSGDLVLKEHEAAKWLDKESLSDVDWLPADISIIGKIKERLK